MDDRRDTNSAVQNISVPSSPLPEKNAIEHFPGVILRTVDERSPSVAARSSRERQSLPIANQSRPSVVPLRQTQSFTKRPKVSVVTIETIRETDDGDDEMDRTNTRKTSRLSHKSSLKSTSRNSWGQESGAFETIEHGLMRKATSKTSLNASENRDTVSGSNVSFQIQREQYCCFSKWSPCEKRLASCVAILGTVIVILVIIVGVLAGDNGGIDDELKMVHPLPL